MESPALEYGETGGIRSLETKAGRAGSREKMDKFRILPAM